MAKNATKMRRQTPLSTYNIRFLSRTTSTHQTHIFDHSVKYYAQMRMKITEIVATRCQILSLKCGPLPRPPSWI